MDEERARHIAQLKKAFEAGYLDEDTYRTTLEGLGEGNSYTATADQGGAIAQDHSIVAGSGGIAIGGGVGGSVVMGSVYVGEPAENPRESLRIYRQVLVNSSAHLPLRGVDVGASDPATAKKLGLANVYIDLDTTSKVVKGTEWGEADLARVQAAGEGEKIIQLSARRVEESVVSVLNAAAENRWLVLTGDPGGGKSTFVNHLAFCLAAHTLYPADGWLDHLPGWPEKEASLLPIVVTLRDFAAIIDESQADPSQPKTLWHFIIKRLENQNLSFTARAIQRELRKGRVMLFLDGLDEVPGVKQRKFVRDAIAAFAGNYPGNRFLVTCRILSYQPPGDEEEPDLRLDLEDFPVHEISSFNEEQIDRFIQSWYAELARIGSVPSQSAEKLAGRLIKAVRRPDLWRLAPNPLLLTVMSLVHAHEGRLPDARALLYERTVDMLLWRWEEVKSGGYEQIPTLRQLLMDAGRADIDLKRLLWRLAYEAHGRSSDDDPQEGLGDISEAQLTHALEKLKREDWQWAHLMVEAMKLRAGLLLEREPGVFTFPHRTFQEYLAGAHLSTQKDFSTQAVDLGTRGALWREPLLLGAGRLVHVAVDVDKALTAVNRLCPARKPLEESDWRNAWLAADILHEVGLERARDDEWGRELLGRVQQRVENLVVGGYLTPRERAEVGETLAEIGDPRPGVLSLEPELVTITAGTFLMGDNKDEITIPESYAIGRMPVTNAQFRYFVEDSGYSEKWRRCWTAEGWSFREGNGIKAPRLIDDPAFNLPNQPVVAVSWYEAVAYANWLGEKTGRPYHLPIEAEWERAARHTDGRTYPWGEAWRDGIANTKEAGVGRPCAVGIFPSDRSEEGLLDLGGNVNEWCQTRWRDEEGRTYSLPYKPEDGREELQGGDDVWRVVKGGSCYDDRSNWPRCAARFRTIPRHGNYFLGFRVAVSPLPSSGL